MPRQQFVLYAYTRPLGAHRPAPQGHFHHECRGCKLNTTTHEDPVGNSAKSDQRIGYWVVGLILCETAGGKGKITRQSSRVQQIFFTSSEAFHLCCLRLRFQPQPPYQSDHHVLIIMTFQHRLCRSAGSGIPLRWRSLTLSTITLISGIGPIQLVCNVQSPGCCCPSRPQAAARGHYECYQMVLPEEEKYTEYLDLCPCLALALRHGNVDFAKQVFGVRRVAASDFAHFCAVKGDTVCLQYMLGANPGLDLGRLVGLSILARSADCLRMLLDRGAPWQPQTLLYPAQHNRLDILEVVSKHSREWSSHLPSVAGAAGNVRFLIRAFDAGCPMWTTAQDGEPRLDWLSLIPPGIYPPKEEQVGSNWRFLKMKDWSLVVSSDLVLSGPVLLYAARKGAPLTSRMQGRLGDVRRRALALAGCFHRAACLSQTPGAAARRWGSMGKVPVDIVRRIATMARISIVELDLLE